MTRPRLTTPLLAALIAVLAPLASAQHTTHDHGSVAVSYTHLTLPTKRIV